LPTSIQPASHSACTPTTGRREGEQPHRQLLARLAARELDHRRAQAEAGALREEAEQQADGRAAGGQHRRFACAFEERGKVHASFRSSRCSPLRGARALTGVKRGR
jgi:hypothetical protein